MSIRGFKTHLIGREIRNKILASIIIPILTYGLEAYPMTEENYKHLDSFVSEAIQVSNAPYLKEMNLRQPASQSEQVHNYWDLFENELTPPSLLIKRNKITLYIKSTRNVQGLNLSLLKSFKFNFLLKEIKLLEQEWSFTTEDLVQSYTGKKLVPKDQIKQLLNKSIETFTNTFLDTTNWFWDSSTEGYQPARLPDTINKPNIQLLQIRREVITQIQSQSCNLCNGKFNSQFHHCLHDCSNPMQLLSRKQLWESIVKKDKQLELFLKSLPKNQLTRVMAGLQQTQSIEANYFLIQLTQETYCTD